MHKLILFWGKFEVFGGYSFIKDFLGWVKISKAYMGRMAVDAFQQIRHSQWPAVPRYIVHCLNISQGIEIEVTPLDHLDGMGR